MSIETTFAQAADAIVKTLVRIATALEGGVELLKQAADERAKAKTAFVGAMRTAIEQNIAPPEMGALLAKALDALGVHPELDPELAICTCDAKNYDREIRFHAATCPARKVRT